jgi:hypothetical protein
MTVWEERKAMRAGFAEFSRGSNTGVSLGG